MFRTKKKILCLIAAIIILITTLSIGLNKLIVHAETNELADNVLTTSSENEATPYLLTSLTISINGGDGKVWITAKNEFTLFPSKVEVVLLLYYSLDYCEDYNKMTLAAINSITDLDMGKTLTATASTDGEERYWIGRLRYKSGSDWKEKTVWAKYSATGEFIM